MMSNDAHASRRRDDGFRVSDAVVEDAVTRVMSAPLHAGSLQRYSGLAMAAAIALILGLGLAVFEFAKPAPCVTFACQLEALSDEELSVMVDLMEDELLLGTDGDEDWPLLY